MKTITALAFVLLALWLTPGASFSPAHACVDNPEEDTIFWGQVDDMGQKEGLPDQICNSDGCNNIIVDPFQTVGASLGDSCGVALRLSTSLVASLDSLILVETGTDTPVAGWGTWELSAVLSTSVESISTAGAGNDWFAFTNDLIGTVPSGVEVDFVFGITL